MKYRFCMQTAQDMGFKEHPQKVIRSFAPDAHDFEPVSIADCWLFEAAQIAEPPKFFTALQA